MVDVTLGTSILLIFASTKLNNDYDKTPPPPEYTNHKSGLQVKVKRSENGKYFIYVLLPPRSIMYSMTGQARYNIKNGVENNRGVVAKELFGVCEPE